MSTNDDSPGPATGTDSTEERPFSPDETLFHSEPWRAAVETSFDLEIEEFTPVSEDGGRAFYSVVSDIRGDRIVSTPFSDFCDPLLGPAGWSEFRDHLRSFDLPITVRPFRNPVAINDDSFERRSELLWHGIDLRDGYQAVWSGLKTKIRTKVRRAAKESITMRWSNDLDDLARFHEMHVGLRKAKYRLLAQPFGFFVALHERFGDDLWLLIAEQEGTPVGAMVFFEWNGVLYMKFSASTASGYGPNTAMVMEACREGSERGLSLLDMGRSDVDQPGLVSFKQQFGGEELELTTLHWAPDGYHNAHAAEVGATLSAVTELLTRPDVPDDVTADAGALLYGFFA